MRNIMIPRGYFLAVGRLRCGGVAFLCSGWSVCLQRVVIDCECACLFSDGGLLILARHRHAPFSGTLGKVGGGHRLLDRDPRHATIAFDDRVRVVTDHVSLEKENASVKRLLQRARLRIVHADISGVIYDGRPLSRELVDNLGACQFAENHADVASAGYGGDRQGSSDIRPG